MNDICNIFAVREVTDVLSGGSSLFMSGLAKYLSPLQPQRCKEVLLIFFALVLTPSSPQIIDSFDQINHTTEQKYNTNKIQQKHN
jgi:hypothetical protein